MKLPTAPTFIKQVPLWMMAVIGYVAIVVALWQPTGLHVSGWGDEWLHMLTMDILPLDLRTDIRPLLRLPWAVAYWLTPDSFLAIHLLLALAFFIKGLALYGVVRRLIPAQPAPAYAAGALLIVYPADDATFNLAVLGIHLSLCGWLVATYCLLCWWKQSRWIWVIGIWVGLIVSLGIVEIGYPLMLLTPLLLLLLEQRFKRRMWKAAVVWYGVLILPLIWVLLLLAQGYNITGYQSSKFAADNSLPALLGSVLNTYRWQVWDAWPNTIPNSAQRLADPLVWLTLVVVAVSAVVLWLHGQATREAPVPRTYGWLFLIGLVALGAGYAAFLPSNLRDLHERTTIYSAVGASLVVALVVWGAGRLPRVGRLGLAALLIMASLSIYSVGDQPTRFTVALLVVIAVGLLLSQNARFAVLIAALVGMGTGFLIDQHKNYVEYARRQQPTLTALITAAPSLKPDTLIVVFSDQDVRPYQDFIWRNDVFAAAIRYLYGDPDQQAVMCYFNQSADPQAGLASCSLERDRLEVVFESGASSPITMPYSQIIAFGYSGAGSLRLLEEIPVEHLLDGGTVGYNPILRIDSLAPLPPRLTSVFGS